MPSFFFLKEIDFFYIFGQIIIMNCKNCDETLNNTYHFCFNCGGRIVKNRISVKSLFTEFFERYLSFDSKFFTTFKMLFLAPEKVINGYIDGGRNKYIDPFSYLFLAITLSGISYFLIKSGWFALDLSKINEIQSSLQNTNQDVAVTKMQNKLNSFIFDYQNLIILISIPLLAFIAKLTLLKNKKYNFAEHNVVLAFSYSHTLISLFPISLVGLFFPNFYRNYSLFTLLFSFVYLIYVVKRVYSLTTRKLIKSVLIYLLLFLLIFFVIAISIGILYAMFFATKVK